jgi:hypothetical protein
VIAGLTQKLDKNCPVLYWSNFNDWAFKSLKLAKPLASKEMRAFIL